MSAETIPAIAIDGPAGAGKSTVARAVAGRLGFLYVDTGAMYRAVARKAMEAGVDLRDPEAMGEVARGSAIAFSEDGTRIFLDGEDVSAAIRTPEVTAHTRYAARARPVREDLVRRQRAFAEGRPVVMEGRDIGTVVLPRARWKFFLDASAEERTRRRAAEMEAAGHTVNYDDLLAEMERRDASDRAVGPLAEALDRARRPDGDYLLVDTTGLSREEVIETLCRHVAADGEG